MRTVFTAISLLILTAAMSLYLPSCTERVAGAGSETTNGISGNVVTEEGTPAEDAVVKLVPAAFNLTGREPVSDLPVDTTDPGGSYHFTRVSTGLYNIIMRRVDEKTGCRIDSIDFDENDRTLTVPAGMLTSTAAVKIDFSDAAPDSGSLVFIPGTDISVNVAGADVMVIGDIPEGRIPGIYVLSDTSSPTMMHTAIDLMSADTVTISKPLWRFSRTLTLNTTSSGVPLSRELRGFPALIRLTSSNFGFGDAKEDGADLRFTKTDGNDLPFEIELWDPDAQAAVVWVTIDTLYPDTMQEIVMYWGNGGVSSTSSPSSVFDTAGHFQGVWHLGSAEKDTVDDATVNEYFGTIRDFTTESFTEGVIGHGCRFDGSGGYIQMPGTADSRLTFPEDGSYTVSAWVYVETVDGESRVVVSKGNYHYFIFYTSIHTGSPLWEFSEYQSGSGWDLSAAEATGGGWHLLTGVRDGPSQYLYLDGELVDSTGFTYDAIAASGMTYDFVIGRFLQDFGGNDFCFFNGTVDEVRISSIARSSEWIRLCYENQSFNDKLIMFQQP